MLIERLKPYFTAMLHYRRANNALTKAVIVHVDLPKILDSAPSPRMRAQIMALKARHDALSQAAQT